MKRILVLLGLLTLSFSLVSTPTDVRDGIPPRFTEEVVGWLGAG